jgi:periplasmic copper chaperone A
MRSLFKFAIMAFLTAVAPAAIAQTGGTSTIAVEQPWARATPAGAMTGAVYMTLTNKAKDADRLTAASSDVAAKVQIHEMAVVNGIMKMRQLVNGLAIPAGGSVTLKPGSYHVMLIGLKKQLVAGQTLPLTLTFAKAGNVSITVPIQAIGATQSDKGGMGGMEGMEGMEGMGGMQGNKSGGMGNMEMK